MTLTTSRDRARTPGGFLRAPHGADGLIEPDEGLWGFGGLHGGLTLALMADAMTRHAPDRVLRTATVRFHRPVTGRFRLETALVRTGRTLSTTTAHISTDRGLHADATAVSGSVRTAEPLGAAPQIGPRAGAHRPVAQPAPPAPPPEDCEVFSIPPEFVPCAAHVEIRPVGTARPYAGGTDPELTAWIRLTEDDEPPDPARFMFLADSLAPSYAAVLSTPVPVPTVQLTVHPAPALAEASSPWILLRATTHSATPDGWIDEHLDAWTPEGTHLGSARQLRLVTTA